MYDEDPTRSIISHVDELASFDEVSNSSSTARHPRLLLNPPNSKRVRHSTLTKLKGVVPQQNGNCGSQIYAKHRRIWLGTFKTESEAATAHDSAALKPTTLEAILRMIKDGSYPSKLAEFVGTTSTLDLLHPRPKRGDVASRTLFRKQLTPSDLSKLNRLVITKYAVKYFPPVCSLNVGLSFHDASTTLWKFRYCYWKSSQSYVFTRGWSRFVKANRLEGGDTVTFSCERHEGNGGGEDGTQETFFMINVELGRRSSCSVLCDETEEIEKKKKKKKKKNGIKLFGVIIALGFVSSKLHIWSRFHLVFYLLS